ncbi:hypothetical protein UFOVP328_256 [uncultured Caudovirales phage]|uniref:Uncharacterized protein n=1 Tax=uncultured Caudovirales phage TaxID=2100421 RepID=A0A6J5LY58_9CAUD|nr:hypothetical protein UFOVP328_256 [uncultured Caudovirales phage]
MSTYKNINGDYEITVKNGIGNVVINGNLDVFGNITYVEELEVNDAFIVVAGNNTGTISSMGLVAQKTLSTFAGLRFNTVANAWQISTSVNVDGSPVGAYSNILTGGGSAFVAGSNTQIQFNQGGNFGASANLAFDFSANKLTVQGHQVLGNIGSAPAATANAVTVYNNTPGAGATGLYVVGTSPTINNDELISLTKARLYAIIF